ncbi:MAG: hypothetical protein KBS95_08010 [Alistipes sp.]|nr:hypothetical protein [Candidatus Alistipes equi]
MLKLNEKYIRALVIVMAMLFVQQQVVAQYYSWGSDSPCLKWNHIKQKQGKIHVVYPQHASFQGTRVFYYADAIKDYISFGYRHPQIKMPFIIHPENFTSNGIVMFMPRRVDILSSPLGSEYATPWLKQLVAHEFRHSAQYSNTSRGFPRISSWFIGEQALTGGIIAFPMWALEGDAVLSETAMTTYGRGLQPSFTMEYRALGNITKRNRNFDKWLCGSYKNFVPSHYNIGYQFCSYAYNKYGENVWNKVVRYTVRNPYTIMPRMIAFRKYYRTSMKKLMRETFNNLEEFWQKSNSEEDTSKPIISLPQKNYTSYSTPVVLNADSILWIKKDLNHTNHLILSNQKMDKEKKLTAIGRLSSRIDSNGKKVYWTEYRQSLLFAERINSVICWYDLQNGKLGHIRNVHNAIYATCTDKEIPAYVEYLPNGTYTIVNGERRTTLAPGLEVHDMAYDNTSDQLYLIVTSDDGMSIEKVTNNGLENIKKPSFVTIKSLRASEGKLYFGSTDSGKDEIHVIEIASGIEKRLTNSKYGSFSPYPVTDGKILVTTYNALGYVPSIQDAGQEIEQIEYRKIPRNKVNPPRERWNNLINLDTVRFTQNDSTLLAKKSKRFRKVPHMFNIHSWAPAGFNPMSLFGENFPAFNIGATIMSQNLLSNLSAYAKYAWSSEDGHIITGAFRYTGLGPTISAYVTYGGLQQAYNAYSYSAQDPDMTKYYLTSSAELKDIGKYFGTGISISLPLRFESTRRVRTIYFDVSYDYDNGLVADMDAWRKVGYSAYMLRNLSYRNGLHMMDFAVEWSSSNYRGHREAHPRWGHTLACHYAINPADRNFSDLIMLYGKAYLPGLAYSHSTSVALAYQNRLGGLRLSHAITELEFKSKMLLPKGYASYEISNRNYFAASLRYELPIWYPEGGIPSIVYFSRIRLRLGFDMASFDNPYGVVSGEVGAFRFETKRDRIYSYGGDLIFDVCPLRLPSSGEFTFSLSIYKPTTKKGIHWSIGVGLPF